MMWLNVFLLIVYLTGGPVSYWQAVDNARSEGCRVYNFYWESCPVNPVPAFALYPIPPDAVEMICPDCNPTKPPRWRRL